MPQLLNLLILKLKPLLCVVVGVYAFTSSYPGSFTSSHSHAQQQVNCKTSNNSKVISWTGGCVNGLLEGDGELVFEFDTEEGTFSAKLVSKFHDGATSGVRYMKLLKQSSDGLFWTMLDVGTDSPSIATSSKQPNDDVYNMYWYDHTYDNGPKMNFDEALKRKVALAKKLNQESIDPYILKEYLLGRYKFTKTDSKPGTGSSNLADDTNADDPQAFGGGSSPNATKTKKKKR